MSKSARPDPSPAKPRTWALWLALLGVVVVLAAGFIAGPRLAGIIMAVQLAGLGLIRLLLPRPGPYGISSRSKLFDVTFLWLGAAGTALMSLTATNL